MSGLCQQLSWWVAYTDQPWVESNIALGALGLAEHITPTPKAVSAVTAQWLETFAQRVLAEGLTSQFSQPLWVICPDVRFLQQARQALRKVAGQSVANINFVTPEECLAEQVRLLWPWAELALPAEHKVFEPLCLLPRHPLQRQLRLYGLDNSQQMDRQAYGLRWLDPQRQLRVLKGLLKTQPAVNKLLGQHLGQLVLCLPELMSAEALQWLDVLLAQVPLASGKVVSLQAPKAGVPSRAPVLSQPLNNELPAVLTADEPYGLLACLAQVIKPLSTTTNTWVVLPDWDAATVVGIEQAIFAEHKSANLIRPALSTIGGNPFSLVLMQLLKLHLFAAEPTFNPQRLLVDIVKTLLPSGGLWAAALQQYMDDHKSELLSGLDCNGWLKALKHCQHHLDKSGNNLPQGERLLLESIMPKQPLVFSVEAVIDAAYSITSTVVYEAMAFWPKHQQPDLLLLQSLLRQLALLPPLLKSVDKLHTPQSVLPLVQLDVLLQTWWQLIASDSARPTALQMLHALRQPGLKIIDYPSLVAILNRADVVGPDQLIVFNTNADAWYLALENNPCVAFEQLKRATVKTTLLCSNTTSFGEPQGAVPMQLYPKPEAKQQLVLRADQQQVINAIKPPAAVVAPPGSGKTFLNVALIEHLIDHHHYDPNRIACLTFMDSARSQLRHRLQQVLQFKPGQGCKVLTLHALAREVLVMAEAQGVLPDNTPLDIVDEFAQQKILGQLLQQAILEHVWEDDSPSIREMSQVIRTLKDHQITVDTFAEMVSLYPNYQGLLSPLVRLYQQYQQALLQQGKIDFQDLINQAIVLLQDHPGIAKQLAIDVVIEDEAQDSSPAQQQLLSLLFSNDQHAENEGDGTAKLIRTGDPNQSINTTFTAARLSLYRQYLFKMKQEHQLFSLTQSSRSALPVQQLANHFLGWCLDQPELNSGVFGVELTPVPNENPALIEPMQVQWFYKQNEERQWLVNELKRLRYQYPALNIAVLCRFNKGVEKAGQWLQKAGLPVKIYTDDPVAHPEFVLLTALLALDQQPYNVNLMHAWLSALHQVGVLPEWQFTSLKTNLTAATFWQHSSCELPRQWLQTFQQAPNVVAGIGQLLQLLQQKTNATAQGNASDLIALWTVIGQWLQKGQVVAEWGNSLQNQLIARLKECREQKKLPFRTVVQASAFQSSSEQKTMPIQVMTIHKAKGQEFDIVVIPNAIESNYPSSPNSIAFRRPEWRSLLVTGISQAYAQYGAAPEVISIDAFREQQLLNQVQEEMRLWYVAITRARQGLVITGSQDGWYWQSSHSEQPMKFLQQLARQPQAVSQIKFSGFTAAVSPVEQSSVQAGLFDVSESISTQEKV